MKVILTETTVVSYEIDVLSATNAIRAAQAARVLFAQALDPTNFRHSVLENRAEYTVSSSETPLTFVDEQLQ